MQWKSSKLLAKREMKQLTLKNLLISTHKNENTDTQKVNTRSHRAASIWCNLLISPLKQSWMAYTC